MCRIALAFFLGPLMFGKSDLSEKFFSGHKTDRILRESGALTLPSATMVTRMVVGFQAFLAILALKIVECYGTGIAMGFG